MSNLGMLGVDSFIAIINPPQCAILAVGRVAPRVVADEVGMMIRPMMTATLSADHRVVDGAIAARFLQAVKRRVGKRLALAYTSRTGLQRKELHMKLAITLLSLAWLCLASSPSHAQKVERITMAGGPPTGVFGIFATGIGTYLSKNVPNLDVSVTATGGSVENTRRVNARDAEMGLSFASDVHEAFLGLEKFKDKPLTNLRAIGLVFIRRRSFDHLRGQRHTHCRRPGRQARRRRISRIRNFRQRRAGFSLAGHLGQDQPHSSPWAPRPARR